MFGDGDATALTQLPVFWAAPIVGAVLGAIIYRLIVSGAAPVEKAPERVEVREPEYRERADYRDRGDYRDYPRDDYRSEYRDEYRTEYRDDRY